jgi:hypothetical protein
MKFLKTIRFDPSDTHVFENAAGTDEWAIPGGFAFAGLAEDAITGKRKQAFSNGFLSLESFGHSTFVSVADISAEQVEALIRGLVQYFVGHCGAPSPEEAATVARSEVDFVLELCRDVPVNSVFTLRRFFDEAGEVREEFRIVDPPGETLHTRVWDVVED